MFKVQNLYEVKRIRNILFLIPCSLFLFACSSKDPILPGERHAVFNTGRVTILDRPVPESALAEIRQDAPRKNEYRQDHNNLIWRESSAGPVRIFSGFPTPAHVRGERRPTVTDTAVFAGLSTGEVVKVNRATRNLEWVADVFRASAMTGGSSILDIVAPVIVVEDRFVYAGGLGNAFCKLNASSGVRIWCADIATGVPFVVRAGVSYVAGTDGYLYAVDNNTGGAFWRAEVRKQRKPELVKGTVVIGRDRFDALTGEAKN